MLSKEEIEKTKKGLIEELGRTITANECGLSTNDFSESIEILENAIKYIEQLESDKQKLIERLEGDIEELEILHDNYIDANVIEGTYETLGRICEARKILSILKGEEE